MSYLINKLITCVIVMILLGCQKQVIIRAPSKNFISGPVPVNTIAVTVEKAITEVVGACTFTAITEPTFSEEIQYRVTFATPIDPATFIASDITNTGTGGGDALIWSIENCGDDTNFKIKTLTISGDGTIIPELNSGQVVNLVIEANLASTSVDNTISFKRGWYQEAYIKASNGDTGDEFGYSISLHRDTLAVSTILEDSAETTITNGTSASFDNTIADSGAVYVYKRTGDIWSQEAYIKSVNADTADQFGISVSLSGDTLAVGATNEDSNDTIITNGSTASTDESSEDSGSVYIYRRSGSNWQQEAYIKAYNNRYNYQLGQSVSLDDDTLAVGSQFEHSNQTTITNGPTASTNQSNVAAGAVYVYKRNGTNWAQQAYIKAANNDFGDYFGQYVSLDKDTIAVVSTFERSSQNTITNGTTASSDDSLAASGAVYVYKRTGVNWTQQAYVKPSLNQVFNSFGYYGASISGDTITAIAGTGFYTFKRNGSTWIEESRSSLTPGINSIKGNTLIIGVAADSSNQTSITNGTTSSADVSSTDSGAVFVYKKSGVNWVQEAYIKAPNNSPGDKFGSEVKIHGDTIAVSAPFEDSSQTTITNGSTASSNDLSANSGAVYIFRNKSRLFEIHDLRATATSNSVTLTWSRTGGSAVGYFVAYAAGATAPINCNSGTNIDVGDLGTYTETPLSSSSTYSFRVCATDGISVTSGQVETVTTAP